MCLCVCVCVCVYVQAILSVCDSSLSRAVRGTIFVTSMADAAALLHMWRATSARSSVSFVEVASLPRGALVEFQVSALNKHAPPDNEVRICFDASAPSSCCRSLTRTKFVYAVRHTTHHIPLSRPC